MNLKTFLQTHIADSFEIIPGAAIINVCVENTIYGLDVDTSSITSGILLMRSSSWALEDDILTVEGLSLNTNDINVLGAIEEEIL